MAYSLQLPSHSKIHSTFHVLLLKRHEGLAPTLLDNSLPQSYDHNSQVLSKEPETVLEVRSIKKHNAAEIQWLVKWKQQPVEDATWEIAANIMQKYPTFDPWGQGSSYGGGINTMVTNLDHTAELERQSVTADLEIEERGM